MKCCSDTISTWYHWFEPARLGGWSCNKQVIQLMGAESVTTNSYSVNGGAGRIPLLGASPAAAAAPWLLLAVAALPGAAVGERCMEEAEFVFQWQLSIVSCAGGCEGTRGLCGVPELLGGCPALEGARRCSGGTQLLLAWSLESRCLGLATHARASSPAWFCGCGIN